MNPLEARLERLAALGFRILPAAGETHVIFERGGFVALVERTADGFGNAGSAGVLTENGFAALVWRGDRPFFVLKNSEEPATEDEVASLRAFAADLDDALKAGNQDK